MSAQTRTKPRSATYRDAFKRSFSDAKDEFGHGVYSWTEGVTRKSARLIARNRARKAMKAGSR